MHAYYTLTVHLFGLNRIGSCLPRTDSGLIMICSDLLINKLVKKTPKNKDKKEQTNKQTNKQKQKQKTPRRAS